MKKKLTDEELLSELKRHFEENKKMLDDERILIEQLNAVNQKLLASEHLKTNFLSNIRNEINNPIASILELSKNIKEGQMDIESMKRFASLIFSEIFDLDFQLRNIFLSAEIEAGESPLSVVSVNVSSLISNILESFRAKIEKKSIRLVINNSIAENTIFKTDSEKLHLILSNLLANAIQFNNYGGEIEINTKIENNQFYFSIKDNGIGFAQDQLEKIYDRFHQIESGATKTYGGHGLGLSITKALLEILGGKISVYSELGEGSSFIIEINQLDITEGEEDVYSSDGNDFLFDQDEDDMLF